MVHSSLIGNTVFIFEAGRKASDVGVPCISRESRASPAAHPSDFSRGPSN
jgi:hypothetical protein